MDEETDDIPCAPSHRLLAVARALARAFLAGERAAGALRERGEQTLGKRWPWLVPMCLHLHFEFGERLRADAFADIVGWIAAYPPFQAAFFEAEAPNIRRWYRLHPSMQPLPPPLAKLALPALAPPGELADWLGLSPGQLDWFAQTGRCPQASKNPKFAHYRYHWIAKADGSPRLIEAPKEKLRAIQRHILHGILDRVPLHDAACGCVRGRSVVDYARRHAGQPLLLKMDLRDFFTSIDAGRIQALFRTLGYPPASARYLTGLTTQRTPLAVLRQAPSPEYPSPEERRRQQAWRQRFATGHLPQGAPTSPALANLCTYRLDLRLDAAARACGATYSRYVDDLAVSLAHGDAAQGRRIMRMLTDICLEEGFTPNWRKSRLVPAACAQRLTSLVVN